MMGKCHEDTCASKHLSSSLESVLYIIPGSHGVFIQIKIIVKLKYGKKKPTRYGNKNNEVSPYYYALEFYI
jgi:hypothetical protein